MSNPLSPGTVSSVPPTVNPAKRTSKGFSGVPSPRATSCACGSFRVSTSHGLSWQVQRKFSLLDYASALFTRPLLLTVVLLLSNYLGHFHPILWTASDRAALLALFSHPLASPFAGYDGLGTRSDALRTSIALPAREETSRGVAEEDLREQTMDFPGISDDEAQGVNQAIADTPPSPLLAVDFHVQASGSSDLPETTASASEANSGATAATTSIAATTSEATPANRYVTPWAVEVPKQRSCRKIFPHHLVRPSQGPITFVGDIVRQKRQRLLLTIPRHGLGNSLRGYVSSYVYAALSGRRLVRFHGAEHAKVFDTLCHSFQCGFESIEADESTTGGPVAIHKQLELLNPLDLNSKFKHSTQVLSSLRSTRALMVSKSPHFYDGFWRNFPLVQKCVYDAFGCSSTWCVRSRALQALIGRPTPLLEDVISKVLRRHVATNVPDVPANRGANTMFDVAIHFRTRPAAIESKHPGEEANLNKELIRIGCGKEEAAGESSQFLKACLWDCLGSILQKLQEKKDKLGRPLDILLATDNQALRPAFVERLVPYGTVYYSSGVIVHSSKSASLEAERLPTMAEFHLMSRAHTILEAGSYVSTFAYFSGLLGNATLAGIEWKKQGGCDLKVVHRGPEYRARASA